MSEKHFSMGHDTKYTIGFNTGYLIAKHEPDLADKLTCNLLSVADFFQGFVDGKEQQIIETKLNELQQLKSFRLKENRER